MEFEFTSDHVALDFAGTRMHRDTSPSERLAEPGDLVTWALAARLVDDRFRVDPADFAGYIELREAIYRSTRAILTDSDPAERDRRTLNRFAGPPPVTLRLLRGSRRVRGGEIGNVLSTLARAAIDLAGGEDRDRLRGCAGDGCTRLFVDRSRAGSRRWCGMAICGSRVKAAAYRRRKRAAVPG